MTLRLMALVFTFLSLSGCATFHTTMDNPPGKDMNDYIIATRECSIYHREGQYRYVDREYFYACLEKKGYTTHTTVRTNYNPFTEGFWTGIE